MKSPAEWPQNMIGCKGNDHDRFAQKYSPEPNTGCWLWTGASDGDGYGQFWMSEHQSIRIATRASYEMFIGVDPGDLHVLHRCDVPACVNPAHLFLGSHADNMRDMWAKGRTSEKQRIGQLNASKTHCPRGHAYSETNTYRSKGTGYRHCRACRRLDAIRALQPPGGKAK